MYEIFVYTTEWGNHWSVSKVATEEGLRCQSLFGHLILHFGYCLFPPMNSSTSSVKEV